MSNAMQREIETVNAMIKLYCEMNHKQSKGLCNKCQEIRNYAINKIEECPYQPNKPICKSCKTHCYEPVMREEIRKIMRFSGPKLIWHHPILAIRHLMNKRRQQKSNR
jgi:hypothetical protein